MTWPGSALTRRSVASALPPLGRIMSVTPPCWPGSVSNCAALMTSRIRSASPSAGFDGNAGENAAVGAGDEHVARPPRCPTME